MTHFLVLGPTEQGKTLFTKALVRNIGCPILVLTAMPGEWMDATEYVWDDLDDFLDVVFTHTGCCVIVDEAIEFAGQYDKASIKLATRGRHYGHRCFFLVQQFTALNRTIRLQCLNTVVFGGMPLDEYHVLWKHYNQPRILEAANYKTGECLMVERGKEPEHFTEVWNL